MNRNELIAFIQENVGEKDFTGGVDQEKISETEEALGVVFPESYKWFLKTYGMGGLFGVEILGCGKSAVPSVITFTERLRHTGLPPEYIVIEDCDEFMYCLDTNHFDQQECPVISWDRVAGFSGRRAENFQEFLVERLVEAKENWEEDL